ncbi:MAG: terminase large subunit [Tannerellaceae bacterium]|jgi:phage terminase large subunit-like protein|nr:terminase large subunit [Tannerellaceae bacterium]
MIEIEGEKYYQYAAGILDGSIAAGRWMRLAAERFMVMLDNPEYEFREKKVNRVIRFVSMLKHFQSPHKGKPFVLQDWQCFIVAGIYGFYVRETGNRLVRRAYIEVPRKNGKTALSAALCLYHLVGDGVSGGQVYMAANSRDQVKMAGWPLCAGFAKSLDPEETVLKTYRDQIRCLRNESFMRVLPAEAKRLDGLNPSMWLIDEYHAAKNADVLKVLESGEAQRRNPLGIVITTAGFDLLGACYEHRQVRTEVLSGLKSADEEFIAIFTLDEEDDWGDSQCWQKANPNYGVTVTHQFLVNAVNGAKNHNSEVVNVKTKNFNVWCQSGQLWIPDTVILAASKAVEPEQFRYCYVGIDLAATSDLTAMSALFVGDEGKLYFKTWYYLPREALEADERFAHLYGEWARKGELTLTPGNVTNYEYVQEDLMRLHEACPVVTVAYDKWNSTQFIANVQGEGFKVKEFAQTTGNMNRPTKEMERLMRSGGVVIDTNAINRYCFLNVELFTDHFGNIKPTKQYQEKKIDGVMAMLNALGVYLLTPQYSHEL